MSASPSSSSFPHRRIPTAARILALLALSALLHLLAIDWAGGGLSLPRWRSEAPPTVQVELKSAPAAVPIAPPPPPKPQAKAQPKPPPRPKPRRQARVRPPAPPVAVLPPSPPIDAAAPADIAPQPEQTAATPAQGDAAEAAKPQAATPAPSAPVAPETPKAAEAPPPVFRMPPSAELKYEVQALREGQTVYGSGKIAWRSGGTGYEVRGEAGVLFFTLLEFGSRGMVDEHGVAPTIYTEKRFRRSETATHFRREEGLISFSSSTVTYPRHGGEQDRASIVWQLAALGLGEPGRFAPGAQIDVFVAGVRDGETWSMKVQGLEDIDTASGRIRAWHVVRVPRPGSYEQKLDIWLAPERHWYPMRLRWTETNGEYLDMSASSVTPLPPLAPPV
ncbi:DUF3108 domain-containing protein [Noviherbaspirillum pedocola]|uniref:DUF3108 domain-containing protein n=1 Tax=Noviherbaspirillum pedocola TaxID=2801341 RepID=A0A934SW75_9BURK|nr:DUF3108 domain-containing protein [Noviherbaspirillum pedocola]MBK4736533.1 DUF3108 domain-containing protein [Noviherbaspirillum pedocola]